MTQLLIQKRMTKDEYKELVTPEIIRELFEHNTLDHNQEKYALTIGGKIISVGGKFFYDSREQAVKAFYNMFSWRARRTLWMAAHPNDTSWAWWRQPEGSDIWKAFKEAITEHYGFNVIQI